jgi:hypothetical protein
MYKCCDGSNKEVLSILLGYGQSPDVIKKSLWWISEELNNNQYNVIVIDDGQCGDIAKEMSNYVARICPKIISINNAALLEHYKIDSIRKSKKLAYAICEKFSSNKRVYISPRSICYGKSFKSFCDQIQDDKVMQMRSYLVPLYVQEAISDYSSNFCNFLANECKKYPIYTENYPEKSIDYITQSTVDSLNNKEALFSEHECFYLEPKEPDPKEHLETIDLELIDKILEN